MALSRGFSLIEVVVSVFIIGVMLVMLQAVVHAGTLVRVSKEQGIALAIARNKLEVVRAGGYVNIPSSGTFLDSLVSTLPASATTTLTTSVYNTKTKHVVVTVSWKDPSATATTTISLSTLITETGGLP